MASIKLIGIKGNRITPRGAGWELDGLFFGTWGAAVAHARGEDIPTEEQVSLYADECLDHRLLEIETSKERGGIRQSNILFVLVAMLTSFLFSCSKPATGVVLTMKADNVIVIDHREIRMSFQFENEGVQYTPGDSTLVDLLYNQEHYPVTLPAGEASGYMLPGIGVNDTTVSKVFILNAYNPKVNIIF